MNPEELNLGLVSVLVFITVFLPYVFMATFMRTPKTDPLDLRDRNLPSIFQTIWRPLQLFVEALGKPLAAMQEKRARKIAEQIAIASAKMTPEHVFAAEFALSITLSVLFALLTLFMSRDAGKLGAAFLLGGFIGFAWPSMALDKQAEDRQGKIMKALPFAIDLIGSAMRSGIDFTAAVRYYCSTEEKTAPLAIEFGVMLRELELGRTRSEALEAMSQRIRHDAFTAFTDAVIHGLEIGASIVATMKVQAEELRRVRFNAAERKAARAVSSMIFPIAVFIMPAMFLIIGTPIILRVMSSGLGGMLQ